jgi:NAD(P)H-quinone oxidoreductase subunit 5
MRHMGGLGKYMRGTQICFLIGCLSISGCFPLSGFWSKDDLIGSTWDSVALGPYAHFLSGMLILTAGLTSFYMFRAYYLTFHGEYRGTAHPHNSSPAMVYPLIALAVPSICSGLLGCGPEFFSGHAAANAFGSFVYFEHPHFEAANLQCMGLSVAAAFSGWALAHLVYITKGLTINTKIATSTNPAVHWLYNYSFHKWYWDEIYRGFYLSVLRVFSGLWQAVDQYIVDNIVNGVALFTSGTGQLLKYTENGQGQFYALVIFGWVALLTVGAYLLKP